MRDACRQSHLEQRPLCQFRGADRGIFTAATWPDRGCQPGGGRADYPLSARKTPAFLKLVHSQALQNVCVRVDLTFKGFFRRVKAGEEPGYPRVKGYGRYDSFCYPQYGNGVRLAGRTLILSKLGNVKVKLHRDLCGTPKTVCLRRSSTGKWFVTFSCDCQPQHLSDELKRVGVDVGLSHFFTTSNGDQVDNPRFFRQEEKELAKAQRRMSKHEKGTPERRKRRNTSKQCSRCASIVDKELTLRIHNCPHCGLSLDRDQNAAINILALGLQRMGNLSLEAPGL
ncbi:MAG: hypothetical protein DYG89_02300 [Caldilinea sp. CFX5]|nr:hypothetical protein [Caldilinea sp. CFX5]